MIRTALDAVQGRAHERLVATANSSAVRWTGALGILIAFSGLLVLQVRDQAHAYPVAPGRLTWSLTILAAVAFIARGFFLGRPVTARHAIAALMLTFGGLGAHVLSFDLLGNVLIVGAGIALMWPTAEPAQSDALPRVWALVNATHGDPLAPFAMQSLKSYHFTADDTAAIAYRTRFGFAVVSGDPIGDETRFPGLVADFAAMCHHRGWRIVILGCSQRRVSLWTDTKTLGQSLRAVPFGRDVVIDVAHFDMVGRRYRNLRQAVSRTRNCGITTEVIGEQETDDALLAELAEVVRLSHRGARTERGFSMILDGLLQGRYPGVQLIVARDRSGRVLGFHRYALAGNGDDVSLDVPWRRPHVPNGIDERLSADMIAWSKDHGAQRLSLAFAPFPEIFEDQDRNALQRLLYGMIHLGDPLIRLESLYRYLRKFRALGDRRYVLLSLQLVIPVLFALLTLEFIPRRRSL